MSNLPVLQYRALDVNGDPIAGAKLYFYATGTTTPQATYSDRGLTSANANPVVSDADGWFDIIYMGALAYKVRLTDASDVLIWEEDNVYSLADIQLQSTINQLSATPIQYGAVGDGAADESSEVQAALDAATGVVDLLGKTFRCDSQLSVPDDIEIRNGTLDFSNASVVNGYLLVQGSIGTTTTAVTTGAGDMDIVVGDPAGIAEGDWMLLKSNAVWDGSITLGELIRVRSVVSTVVNSWHPPLGEYASADSATIAEVTMASGQRFRDLTIIGNSSSEAIRLERAANVTLENITFEDCNGSGIVLRQCANIVGNNIKVTCVDVSDIALDIGGGSRSCKFSNVAVYYGGEGVTMGDPDGFEAIDIDCHVSGLSTFDCAAGVNIESGSCQCSVSDSYVGAGDVNVFGALFQLHGLTFLGEDTSGTRISVSAAIDYADIETGTIINGLVCRGGGGIDIASDCTINGAEIESSIDAPVSISTTGVPDVSINGASVVSSDGYSAVSLAGTSRANSLRISNSIIGVEGSGDGITGDGVTSLMLMGNKIEVESGNAVALTDVYNSAHIVGNHLKSEAAGTLVLEGATGLAVLVSGNYIECDADPGGSVVSLDTCGLGAITGNAISRTGDTGVGVLLTSCDNTTFVGNAVSNGTYGLQNSGGTNVISDGAIYVGQATGNTTGTITTGDEI